MSILKQLVTGQYGLARTFWGFGFLGNLFFALLITAILYFSNNLIAEGKDNSILIIAFSIFVLLGSIYSLLVFSGITLILRKKITFFGVVAWILYLIAIFKSVGIIIGMLAGITRLITS